MRAISLPCGPAAPQLCLFKGFGGIAAFLSASLSSSVGFKPSCAGWEVGKGGKQLLTGKGAATLFSALL